MADELNSNLNISSTFHYLNISEIELAPPASTMSIITLSILFFLVGIIGITGNLLVIFAILGDQKMRTSVTNLLIMNLALGDLIIMLACIPDIIQFIGNIGWSLGLNLCKTLRFTEVCALYASVMTLISICVERYVAIIYPIKAHIVCCWRRILLVICVIWPLSMFFASPNLFFHVLLPLGSDFTPCIIQFPQQKDFILFKYAEFLLFYFIPLLTQVVLYIHMGKRLVRNEAIQTMMREVGKEKFDATMKARKGVIKMLVAGVTVYFISFSPHQILLVYNTFSSTPFHQTWSYLIFVNIMAYTSSASNPLLYSIFSQKFRQKFQKILSCFQKKTITSSKSVANARSKDKQCSSKNTKTTITEV